MERWVLSVVVERKRPADSELPERKVSLIRYNRQGTMTHDTDFQHPPVLRGTELANESCVRNDAGSSIFIRGIDRGRS